MEQRKDKGTAGLTLMLSLITMLFVIGLIVMIFAVMSGEIADTDIIYYTTGTLTSTNETLAQSTAGTNVAVAGYRNVHCTALNLYNGTTAIGLGNVTEVSECKYSNSTISNGAGYTTLRIYYSYIYDADSTGAVDVINDTSSSIASVTDWFDIFIVIGAMVVLILLVVIIITTIKGSGMVDAGSQGRPNVGTA